MQGRRQERHDLECKDKAARVLLPIHCSNHSLDESIFYPSDRRRMHGQDGLEEIEAEQAIRHRQGLDVELIQQGRGNCRGVRWREGRLVQQAEAAPGGTLERRPISKAGPEELCQVVKVLRGGFGAGKGHHLRDEEKCPGPHGVVFCGQIVPHPPHHLLDGGIPSRVHGLGEGIQSSAVEIFILVLGGVGVDVPEPGVRHCPGLAERLPAGCGACARDVCRGCAEVVPPLCESGVRV
mmetsp:Transcript_44730/g.142443  ORF Transcript_44730/g.142443 Transcript_44730/m.142443 type:complete len:237 (-) Transcript_44730:121-831(-)